MDGVIKFFTTEAGLFVRHLRYFSNIENVRINRQLVELLTEAVMNIRNLLEHTETMDMQDQSVVKLIFDFDERQYCLRRFLECRSCCKNIPLSTEDYEEHLQTHHHNMFHNLSTSLFSPEMSSEADTSIYQNKMATYDYETNHNQHCDSSPIHSEDEPANNSFPKYSDVICNTSPVSASRDNSTASIHSSDDQSEHAPDVSVDSGYGSSYLVKIRGLPWTTTKKDLRDFFANVSIANDLDGIHFITDDENNFGVAYIQLTSGRDYEIAQTYHRKKLDERYIEVLKASKQDFVTWNAIQKSQTEERVLRLEGLPWNSKEIHIREFFSGLRLNHVALILDKSTDHTLEAFVRFATDEDYDKALKRNWQFMGNRHVKIFRSSEKQMKLRIEIENERTASLKIKQTSPLHEGPLVSLPVEHILEKKSEWQHVGSRRAKAEAKKSTPVKHGFYMVMARGFQWKVTKKDVMAFFKGIKILNGEKGINIMKNVAMEAYVELSSKADVKKALALNNKSVETRTVHVTEISAAEHSRIASCISETNGSKVVQIRGLPWSVDKAYIMNLFPAIKIPKEQIQIEIDENNRRTGYAFVELQSQADYDAAFKSDFKAVNVYIKLFKATKEQYLHALTSNKTMNKSDE